MDMILPEGGKGLLEFTSVKLFVSVEVHALKNQAQSSNSNASPLLDSELELEVHLTDHHIAIYTVECHLSLLHKTDI